MTKVEFERASNLLKDAVEATEGDAQERLHEQLGQLATLATCGQGPDHGRLARHMTVLYNPVEDLDGDAAETVCEARSEVLEYRRGIPGV